MSTPPGPSITSNARPAFLAFVTDAASLKAAREFAEARHWQNAVSEGTIATAIERLSQQPSPEVLVVEIPDPAAAPELLDKLADVCDPGVKVIAAGTVNEYSFYCWLMEIGISGYLLEPFTSATIEAAWHKASEPAETRAKQVPSQEGKVVALLGTRGGVGVTTLAANIAHLVSSQSKKPTVLLDLDPHQGACPMTLDLEPGRGLREALEKPDRIDGMFLERVTVKYDQYLSVIGTEEALEENILWQESAADALLRETRKKYAYVIVDMPRQYNPLTRAILSRSDTVLMVTETTLLGLRDALRLQDLLKDKLKIKPPVIVASKTGLSPKHEMTRANFDKALGAKISHMVPFSQEVLMSAAAGELVVQKSVQCPAAQALYHIAAQIAPDSKSGKDGKPGRKLLLPLPFKKKTG